MNSPVVRPESKLDLVLRGVVDVPRELLWIAWSPDR